MCGYWCRVSSVITVWGIVTNAVVVVSGAARIPVERCPSDAILDYHLQTCCTICEPGFGIIQPCTVDNSSVCAPCVDGQTYSARHSYRNSCQQCTKCPLNSIVLQACNATQDTVCSNYNIGANFVQSNRSAMWEKQSNLVPLYCGLLGSVVGMLIIYVVVKNLNIMTRCRPSATGAKAKPATSPTTSDRRRNPQKLYDVGAPSAGDCTAPMITNNHVIA